MKHNKLLFLIAALSIAIAPNHSWAAKSAQMLLSPTRIIIEDGKRFATVTVRNNGDATGRYRVEFVDTKMAENGSIKILEEGQKDEFSALDIISFSPKGMTLKPDEYQTVRILIKNNTLPDGEYKSHLQVRMTENNMDPETGTPSSEGASVMLKPLVTTVIPVIVRKGQTSFDLKMDDAKLVMGGGEGKQVPEVQVALSMSGNRSALGDIKVTHIAPDGKESQLAFFRGIAIYRGVAKRTQSVVLDVPQGINIHSGKLLVSFLSQENEGSRVLAEKSISP